MTVEDRTAGAVRDHECRTGSYFVANYPPFSCWRESETGAFRELLASAPAGSAPPLGIYVHIPFCATRCEYCYYLSYDDRSGEIDRYLTALEREARLYAERPRLGGREPDFVYFGGGTPSLLSTKRLRRLLDGLGAAFDWRGAREVSFECAPKSVGDAKLELLADRGVTRISLGIQQLDDEVLRRNGRIHRVADVRRAWEAIRRADFPVANVDLIAGLRGQTDEGFRRSLDETIELGPDSITVYQLEIPLSTPLARAMRRGPMDEPPAGWSGVRKRLAAAFERLERAGYTLRSGYSAVRDPRRHAFVYQEEQYRGCDLLGLGASAFSYVGGSNQQNLAGLEPWLRAVESGRLPLGRAYRLSDDERLVREMILRLKLGSVPVGELREKFGIDPRERFAPQLAPLEAAGELRVGEDSIAVTREGLLRVDRLARAFYLPEHRGVRYS